MPIRFPKHHIAKSVVAQIMNFADGLVEEQRESEAQAAPRAPVPDVPQTAVQSAVLDQELASPIREPLPGIDEAPDPGGTLSGDRLLNTMLEPES